MEFCGVTGGVGVGEDDALSFRPPQPMVKARKRTAQMNEKNLLKSFHLRYL